MARPLDALEHIMEEALEGTIQRLFRPPLQPVQLAKAAARRMDEQQVVGPDGPAVPSSYTIGLQSADFERFARHQAALERELARYLEGEGRLVRLGDGFAIAAEAYERARTLLVEEIEREGAITLARFRDLLGTGRRPAQLLLERFDADGITRRVGDERVLRRRAAR
jgi:hypothetical protein